MRCVRPPPVVPGAARELPAVPRHRPAACSIHFGQREGPTPHGPRGGLLAEDATPLQQPEGEAVGAGAAAEPNIGPGVGGHAGPLLGADAIAAAANPTTATTITDSITRMGSQPVPIPAPTQHFQTGGHIRDRRKLFYCTQWLRGHRLHDSSFSVVQSGLEFPGTCAPIPTTTAEPVFTIFEHGIRV